MKKILFVLATILLTSCTSKEFTNFNGCKYEVSSNLFSSDTEIKVIGDYAPIDVYIIILDEIIDNNESKNLIIHLSEKNIKFIPKEDVKYIKENGIKINSYDNILTALDKANIVVKRLSSK